MCGQVYITARRSFECRRTTSWKSATWEIAPDSRVCDLCDTNAAQGPVRLGQRFSSGDRHPPGHPRCRCALVPYLDDLGKSAQSDHNSLKDYWLHGEGAAKWATWTELYHHLRKHVSDEYAKRIAAQWYHDRYGKWPGQGHGKDDHG